MAEEATNPVEQPTEVPSTDPVMDVLNDTETPAAPVETPVEPTEPKEETGTEGTDDKPEDESTPEDEQKSEEGDDQDGQDELDPKEVARRRYEERQKVREERRNRVDEQTKKYIEEAADETEERLRTIEAQEYNRIIEHNENVLISDFDRAKANPDLQIFNPDNKDAFDQGAWDYALATFNDAYLVYDANNNLVGMKKSLYEHLTQTAGLLQGAVKKGQIQQVRATRTMSNNADTKPAAPPVEKGKSDPIGDILASDD